MLELPTVVTYFDLSLQHASASLLRRMKRWGGGDRFLAIIDAIRAQVPDAVFRSSFITGFPGEREADHDELLAFLAAARLDWAGFFAFSKEDGTPAAALDGAVAPHVVAEWLVELAETQEPITAAARRALVGTEVEVVVDGVDDDAVVGRTWREAPEIDGVVRLSDESGAWARAGARVRALVTDTEGPDLDALPLPHAPSRALAEVAR
jgi:ribosomal protein S12 methylthiotransferase